MPKGLRLIWLFFFFSSFHPAWAGKGSEKDNDFYNRQLHQAVFHISMVMLHDVTDPPAASRYYTYTVLGAYELMSHGRRPLPELKSFLKYYPGIEIPAGDFDARASAVYCILESGRILLPSGYLLEDAERQWEKDFASRLSVTRRAQSIAAAKKIAAAIVQWSLGDKYNRLSGRLRYTPLKGEGYWYPTPPAYIEAVQPHWRTIRTMVVDSASEFVPRPLVPFSKDSSSVFYHLAMEVYNVAKRADSNQLETAAFWDCNPFAVSTAGHLSIGFKKISPGGHWMNIAGIACRQAGIQPEETAEVYVVTAVALMDGFISCWDEKYRSNRIRPETFIDRYIDPKWTPYLQTPPFPEYTSGHSVISTAASEVLTYLFGDDFSYTDDSEMMFELMPRKFSSFRQAAAEASISRLYGGIHYRDAIVNGQAEGNAIAGKVIAVIKAAGMQPVQKKKK